MNNQDDDDDLSIDNFDFEKYNMDRDSVDTMELLKDEEEDEDENDTSDGDRTIASSRSETAFSNRLTPINQMNEQVTNESIHSVNKSASNLQVVNMNPITEHQLVPTTKSETYQTLNDNSDNEIFVDDLINMEEKLRNAWIKMRKLDKKLEKCCKQERMVKRETIALIEKNRAEIESLRIETNHKESKHEAENTAHFLALSYGDLDDEMKINDNFEEDAPTPLFKTQLPYDCDNISMIDEEIYLKKSNNTNSINHVISDANKNKANHDKSNSDSFSSNSKSKSGNNKQKSKPKGKTQTSEEKEKVNFIRRNIQLAQDSNGPLAMTEDEKLRLNELLIDTDNIDTKSDAIENNQNQEISELIEYNPFAVAVVPGDGFTPNKQEGARLHEINSSLEKRLSRINSCINGSIGNSSRLGTISVMTKKSIASTNINDTESYYGLLKMEPKQIKLNDEFDENDFGDKFIREARVSREQEIKLKQIETQLERLKNNESQASNKSEIDMMSEKNSISTISLVNEKTIKDLIEEYNLENNQSIHNYKLDTLKEEDNISSYSDANCFDNLNELLEVPTIHESIINSLIEEARNEGITVLEDNKMTEGPLHSYYDEAIEILRNKSNHDDDFMTEEDSIDKKSIDELDIKKNNDQNKIIYSEHYQSIEEKANKKNILPPLLSRTDHNSMPEDENTSNTSSRNSSAYLPRIDSRFLPR